MLPRLAVTQRTSTLGGSDGWSVNPEVAGAAVDRLDPLEGQAQRCKLGSHEFQPVAPALKINQQNKH